MRLNIDTSWQRVFARAKPAVKLDEAWEMAPFSDCSGRLPRGPLRIRAAASPSGA